MTNAEAIKALQCYDPNENARNCVLAEKFGLCADCQAKTYETAMDALRFREELIKELPYIKDMIKAQYKIFEAVKLEEDTSDIEKLAWDESGKLLQTLQAIRDKLEGQPIEAVVEEVEPARVKKTHENCAHCFRLSGCSSILCTGKMNKGLVPLHTGACAEWIPKEGIREDE